MLKLSKITDEINRDGILDDLLAEMKAEGEEQIQSFSGQGNQVQSSQCVINQQKIQKSQINEGITQNTILNCPVEMS